VERRPDVEWGYRSGEAGLRLTGLRPPAGGTWVAEDLPDLVQVYPTALVAGDLLPALPPMAGRYEPGADEVWFWPRFGFSAGTSYTIFVRQWNGAEGVPKPHDPLVLSIAFPADSGRSTTEVVELYPTAGCIPFNQLRMYVYFSAPMTEGRAARHVHVLDDISGKELSDALLPLDPELWDRDRRRLTLLFDPARIKQGLKPHEEAGYPLVPGRPIRVVVDQDWRDAAGRPLVRSFERRYQVGADVRRHVDPGQWGMEAPRAGSTEPLVIDFDRTLDQGLLQHSITIRGTDGRRVAGAVAIGAEEQSWAFIPQGRWSAGWHQVEVDHRLEDTAGNSVSRVFDRDLLRADHYPKTEHPTVVPFLVRA
jgi:hypothetical protein